MLLSEAWEVVYKVLTRAIVSRYPLKTLGVEV